MAAAGTIRCTLCGALGVALTRMERTSPMATAFARKACKIPPQVLARHALEHIFRIRMFRSLDMAAARTLQSIDSYVAARWARYARSEAIHDRYFWRDLREMELGGPTIMCRRPFASTVQLGTFMHAAMTEYGPLPIVLYSFWAEENSDVGSIRIIDRTREVFGIESVRGASSHRSLDENLDHVDEISRVLAAIIRSDEELMVAIQILDAITDFIGEYFVELGVWDNHHLPYAARGKRMSEDLVIRSLP